MTTEAFMWTLPATAGKGRQWRWHLTPTVLPPEAERRIGWLETLCRKDVRDTKPRTCDRPERACPRCDAASARVAS